MRKGFLIVVAVFSLLNELKAQQRPNILFLIADDLSYPFLGIYGDPVVKTPNLDAIARQGTVFTNAFAAVPSCTASRAAILTGQYPHRLGEGINLVGRLDTKIPTYVQALRTQGYAVAFDRKGWAPGNFRKMGYSENPAGRSVEFGKFIKELNASEPFFFWFGTNDPHRAFPLGAGRLNGIDPQKIKVPAFLPDSPEVRGDLADYLNLIQRFDRETGELLAILKAAGKLENTIIIITGDNGMPFPHAKANLYDYGTHVPLIISTFGNKLRKGNQTDTFVNLIDLTPTFLDIAEIKNTMPTDGKSLLPIVMGSAMENRSEVYLERERHCLARLDSGMHAGYPMRAIRTKDYLYIRNLRPNRTPAGDETIPNTPSIYGDVDGGPTKAYLIDNKDNQGVSYFFNLGFGKRPAEELYLVKDDPGNINNVASRPEFAKIKNELRTRLDKWMLETKDPRATGGNEIDRYEPTTTAWITKWGIVFEDEK